jgi:hypothetical protein
MKDRDIAAGRGEGAKAYHRTGPIRPAFRPKRAPRID